MNGNSGLGHFHVGNTPPPPPPLFNLGKNITDDKTDYSHMAGIEERFFIKMLPALPCSVLKLSTGTHYILYIST
jgi:hypothetical protein